MAAANSLSQRCRRAGLLLLLLLSAATAWGEVPLLERYHALKSASVATLPGSSITLTSSEHDGLLQAEATSILSHPFGTVAAALTATQNWCQFMPLHFNIKACIHESSQGRQMVTLYSGRKTYQSPEQSHPLVYQVERFQLQQGHFVLSLYAPSGPAGTRDYRIEVNAMEVPEGTVLHIRSSYQPSMTSSLLTRTYLSTLGRDKIGFSRSEEAGKPGYVQGVRGVIERNVMRYHLAIETYLRTTTLPENARREAALKGWFKQNERYPEQLHEMTEGEYLAIKRREWQNQQRLQQEVNERQRQLAQR